MIDYKYNEGDLIAEIKDYIDGMEVIMKKNYRVLGKLLTAYTKKRIADQNL